MLLINQLKIEELYFFAYQRLKNQKNLFHIIFFVYLCNSKQHKNNHLNHIKK